MGKLFKKQVAIKDRAEFETFINDSLKPFGFGEVLDTKLNDVKKAVFTALYDGAIEGGASYDSEILFSSLISDMEETYHAVSEHLLTIQRSKGQ